MFTKRATLTDIRPAVLSNRNKTAEAISGFDFEPDPAGGYLYVTSRALTSDVPNLNYDMFPHEEMQTAYKTFIGCPVFVDHHNTDDTRARGVILDAKYHDEDPEDRWTEILMELDEVTFPELCRLVRDGEIDTMSMGCTVESTTCSVCGNEAVDFSEFCNHINQKGATFNGELAYEICHGIDFIEESFVYDPADVNAQVGEINANYEEKVARRRKAASLKSASNLDYSDEWFDDPDDVYDDNIAIRIGTPDGADSIGATINGENIVDFYTVGDRLTYSRIFDTREEAVTFVEEMLDQHIDDVVSKLADGIAMFYDGASVELADILNNDSKLIDELGLINDPYGSVGNYIRENVRNRLAPLVRAMPFTGRRSNHMTKKTADSYYDGKKYEGVFWDWDDNEYQFEGWLEDFDEVNSDDGSLIPDFCAKVWINGEEFSACSIDSLQTAIGWALEDARSYYRWVPDLEDITNGDISRVDDILFEKSLEKKFAGRSAGTYDGFFDDLNNMVDGFFDYTPKWEEKVDANDVLMEVGDIIDGPDGCFVLTEEEEFGFNAVEYGDMEGTWWLDTETLRGYKVIDHIDRTAVSRSAQVNIDSDMYDNEEDLAQAIVDALQSTDYEDLGPALNDICNDPKLYAVLRDLFGGGIGTLELSSTEVAVPVADLYPCQNEIGLDNSLAYPLEGNTDIGVYFNDPVTIVRPIVTYEGTYIIDGHHRWSQVFMLNPDAEITALDITGGNLDPTEVLRIAQGAIAAANGSVPSSSSQGINVYDSSDDEIWSYIDNTMVESAEEGMEEETGIEGREAVIEYICENVDELKTQHGPTSGAPDRDYMPQTDDGSLDLLDKGVEEI